MRISPRADASSFLLYEHLTHVQLSLRRKATAVALADNAGGPRSNLTYIEEAGYFVPVQVALQLQAAGQYTAALDWFRLVYDYSRPVDARKIYYGLKLEESLPEVYERGAGWLLEGVNPHEKAAGRRGSYTSFTALALVSCLLDFGEAEFTRDTPETNEHARILFLTALELLDIPELKQHLGACTDVIGTLEIGLEDNWAGQWGSLVNQLAKFGELAPLEETVGQLNAVLANGGTAATRFAKAKKIVATAAATSAGFSSTSVPKGGAAGSFAAAQTELLARTDVSKAATTAATAAAQDFSNAISLVSGLDGKTLEAGAPVPWLAKRPPLAPVLSPVAEGSDGAKPLSDKLPGFDSAMPSTGSTLGMFAESDPWQALKGFSKQPSFYQPAPSYRFCIPPNPILEMLRLRAELNLFKLRTCRNIAGMERQLDPYSAPTDTESGLPMIGADGQLVLPGLLPLNPTPYRYAVLIERAKHQVGLAQQIEAAMFEAIKAAENERYNQLKASQDLDLARANVRLQVLKVQQAGASVDLAKLQQERAQFQVDHYSELLDEGMTALEIAALSVLGGAAALDLFAGAAEVGPGAGAATLRDEAQAAGTVAQILTTLASFERQQEQWRFEKGLAQEDVRIGVQEVKVAEDGLRIAGQERIIADKQADHAQDTLAYLKNKFTDVELYDWMSRTLGTVYSYFLQQATATARLAASQLAFERQEPPPPFIQADYWQAPAESSGFSGADAKGPDRRGVTGAERLLQDIYKLDQYAFDTNKRKQQLTTTISLARLAPVEFKRFQGTGVMTVATPMELFERQFPGHFLRLVKRASVSLVALVPPEAGINATLTSSRLSRVVIAGDFFQTVPIQRGPDQIAITSPRPSVAEPDPQPEMLAPHEGIGVDTTWEFRMPRAANPNVNYSAIADIHLKIDHTALNSFDYAQQVIQRLKPTLSAVQPFSFRNQLADQWYDLHNPDQTATPMVVRFTTSRADFPPNLDRLKIQHVALYFSRSEDETFEIPITHLRFAEQGKAGPVGGPATTVDGLVSTRNGNGAGWLPFVGRAPFGEWELALQPTFEAKSWFASGAIEDMLFVITYAGVTPAWPL